MDMPTKLSNQNEGGILDHVSDGILRIGVPGFVGGLLVIAVHSNQ